jgi:endonuclease YncB( thermonuclease family)
MLIQTSSGSNLYNEKTVPLHILVLTDFEQRLQHSVSQIINETTTEGAELIGNVTNIVDGDTLDVNGIRVRLSLVDTPERGHIGFKQAKDFVSTLCLGKKGELDVDDGQRRGDRYGREIGIVFCNGVNLNEELMNKGFAKILTDYCDVSEFSKENWTKNACNVTTSSSEVSANKN